MSVSLVKDADKKKFRLPKCLSFLKDINSDFYYYLFLVFLGVCFFAVSLFSNYFTTPLSGDYNSQQFAFYTNGYDDWWRFFRTGEFTLYDTNTFLGASNIGSNSFYYLFDPFFLPLLIFPRAIIPQAMAIMTIFKMALAGLMFSKYLRYIGVTKKTSRVTGIAYGFSGWIAWYLWFNHFTGVAVLFACILYGVEKILKEKKPWMLMIFLALLGFCNFFFFFTFAVCAFLYAMFRFFQGLLKRTARENWTILLAGFVGFLAGCLMAMIVVLPAALVAIHAPRAESSTYLSTIKEALKNFDIGTLVYTIFNWQSQGAEHKFFYPIINFIFPTMTNRGTPLTKLNNDSYDNVAGSLFCYSPFIIFLLPALISSARRKKFSAHIAFALFVLMLLTPFSYYAFHGFTYAYARWNLFVVTSLMAYVSFYIDRIEQEPRWQTLVGGGFAIVMVWLAVWSACVIVDNYSGFTFRYSYSSFGKYGFVMFEGAMGSLYVIIITMAAFFFFKRKYFDKILVGFLTVEVVAMGALTLEGHGYSNFLDVNNGYDNNVAFQELIDKIQKDDPTYYRCYSTMENSGARNDSMRHNYNGLGMFHSVYNFNDYAFLNWSTINDYEAPGSYSASYVEKRQELDTFLGVKYYFIKKDATFWGDNKAAARKYKYYHANVPLGYEDISSQYPNSKFYVFRNKNFIDFAFSFDKVATYKYSDEKTKKEPYTLMNTHIQSDELYLKRAILNPDAAAIAKKYIADSKFATTDSLKADSSLKALTTKEFTKTYYQINKNNTSSGRKDCSAASFAVNLLDLSAYTKLTEKPKDSLFGGNYVTVLEATNNFPYDENGMVIYLKNTYNEKNRINAYIVVEGENEKGETEDQFYTFDNHNDSNLTNTWTQRKNWRGYYVTSSTDENGNFVPAPKVKKIVLAQRKTSIYDYQLYTETYTDVMARLQKFKDNPITDVHYRENHFDFKTNFTNQDRRIIVTQLPWEDGWTVKATSKNGTTKNLELFKAQGGFVSFVAEQGENSYSMDFYTPYLKEGSIISIMGLFLFASTFLGYVFIRTYNQEDRMKRQLGYKRKKNTFFLHNIIVYSNNN